MTRYQYAEGTTRAFRWTRAGDVRAHRPPKGWEAVAELTDVHPITQAPLKTIEWWIIERKVSEA